VSENNNAVSSNGNPVSANSNSAHNTSATNHTAAKKGDISGPVLLYSSNNRVHLRGLKAPTKSQCLDFGISPEEGYIADLANQLSNTNESQRSHTRASSNEPGSITSEQAAAIQNALDSGEMKIGNNSNPKRRDSQTEGVFRPPKPCDNNDNTTQPKLPPKEVKSNNSPLDRARIESKRAGPNKVSLDAHASPPTKHLELGRSAIPDPPPLVVVTDEISQSSNHKNDSNSNSGNNSSNAKDSGNDNASQSGQSEANNREHKSDEFEHFDFKSSDSRAHTLKAVKHPDAKSKLKSHRNRTLPNLKNRTVRRSNPLLLRLATFTGSFSSKFRPRTDGKVEEDDDIESQA
jgi:hypothetical protein